MATSAETPTPASEPERQIIRVDGMPDQAGIAASLRRAFAAGRQDDCDRDFADLLNQLN